MPRVNLKLGLLDKRSGGRILRIQPGNLHPEPLKVTCDLGQRFIPLVVGNVRVVADDLEQRPGRVLGHTKRVADLFNVVLQPLSRPLHCRFSKLVQLFLRQSEIAGYSIVAYDAGVRNAARPSLNRRRLLSGLQDKSN